ncbi:MAG: sortase [Christensenellales bacterium]
MPKKIGIAIVTIGAVLIFSALLLFLHNRHEDIQAGREAESLLERIEAAMDTTEPPYCTPLAPQMPTVMLDGYEYVGYIEIPALNLKLPVMSEWSYSRLKIAPCRQFGSSRTDDLVIAAHNYESHFGHLKDLSAGDIVVFTDMDHIANSYSVEKIETLKPNEVGAVQYSGYDLVLYTCTKGGETRVTVFCNRISNVADPSSVLQEK